MFFHTTGIAHQLWRIPIPIVLAVSILFGFLFARMVLTPPSTAVWKSGHIPAAKTHQESRQPIQRPTPDQRRRVLDLLTTLSPHHTKECTRHAQPLYASQALQRYAPLIRQKPPSRDWWLSGLFGSALDADKVHRKDIVPREHIYYFAINLHNSFAVIPDLFATLFRTAAILGYHNVFVSICEVGSSDQTKAVLRIFQALTRSVGMRVVIRTFIYPRRSFAHPIEDLAELRNMAFAPLHELRDSEGCNPGPRITLVWT